MPERLIYDSVLVHCYGSSRPPVDGYTGLNPRNKRQIAAAAILIKSELDHELVLPGGKLWGENNVSMAEVFQDSLIGLGVSPDAITIPIPHTAKETGMEVDNFLTVCDSTRHLHLASLAAMDYCERIRWIYKNRGHGEVAVLAAENVIGVPIYESTTNQLYFLKEKLLCQLYKRGLEGWARYFSQFNVITRLLKGPLEQS